MYVPEPFIESRVEELHRVIRENSLGTLVVQGPGGLDAHHLPFLLELEGEACRLLAHIARRNPVWREVSDGDEVLIIFRGAQGYVSPNWYSGKQESHRSVPTWNYEVVHAHGVIQVHDDVRYARRAVALLTRQHEASQPMPWKMGDAPADFIDEELNHIVGIEIRVHRLEGNFKLNQHHRARDREGVIRGLEACGNERLAQAMREAGTDSQRQLVPESSNATWQLPDSTSATSHPLMNARADVAQGEGQRTSEGRS